MFKKRPERLQNVFCTFHLRSASRGNQQLIIEMKKKQKNKTKTDKTEYSTLTLNFCFYPEKVIRVKIDEFSFAGFFGALDHVRDHLQILLLILS